MEVALELDRYRKVQRFKARKKYVLAGNDKVEQLRRGKQGEPRLFLSEATGEPVSAKNLYKAWTQVSYKPYEDWHPHLMRHYWACMTLWKLRLMDIQMLKAKHANVYMTAEWITTTATSDIELFLKPQLGHVSKQTTMGYLKWLRQMFDGSDQHDRWVELISVDPSEAGAETPEH